MELTATETSDTPADRRKEFTMNNKNNREIDPKKIETSPETPSDLASPTLPGKPADEFIGTISELCKRFRPIGPTNLQFRRYKDGIKLLEINPRISSSTSIRAAFGYNESAMSVDYLFEHRPPIQPEIKRGRAVRYTAEHIFYEDSIHF